jgi:class 3 adenylate cyclase/tetratricopeptide (TPR) repeat protein
MDGNGRIGRFIMNAMLASGGYPWTIIPVEKRNNYMAALEKATLPPRSQRRTVTILFADLSQFTRWSESQDVEDVRDLVNEIWLTIDRLILSNGGHIDKHMGDGILALWGKESAREDDPEQAIRVALSMQEAMAEMEQPVLQGLKLKVAIHTGPVMLGELGTLGEVTVMGDTVNTVAHLEKETPPGTILISHETYRHVRGLFEVQPLEPMHVRGKAELQQLYLVKYAKPRSFHLRTRGVSGIETHMIGRTVELHHLQRAFRHVLDQGKMQVVTISGDAGIGKTRLLYEFERWGELQPEQYWVFKGRAHQATQPQPFALLRNMMSFRFHVQDSDPAGVVRQKIESGLTTQMGRLSREQAHLAGHLLGYDYSHSESVQQLGDDAEQLRARAFRYLFTFFRQAAQQRPATIFLEDIHWADNGSLDWITFLLRKGAELPILLIALTRPDLAERRPDWGDSLSFHTRLSLQPLSDEECRALLRDILRQVHTIPAELEEKAVHRASGNPFYMEELVKTFIDDGVIRVKDEEWEIVPGRLENVRIPSTLVGVLESRLDRLPVREHLILQRAAVAGYVFWDDAVAFLGQDEPHPAGREETEVMLKSLVQRELIYPRTRSTFAGPQEYVFKHLLLREVVYGRVLKVDRRQYHQQMATWLEEYARERTGEYLELIAEHYESAGRITEAVDYLRQAAEQATTQFANQEAVAYYSRALALTAKADDETRFVLLGAREQLYHLLGAREAQEDDLQKLEAIVEKWATADPASIETNRRVAQVALSRAGIAEMTGQYPAAISAARQAIAHADPAGDNSSLANGYLVWGRALWRQGQYQRAHDKLEQALHLAREAGLQRTQADALRNLGVVVWSQGDNAACKAYLQEALPIYRDIGDLRGEGAALNNLGVIHVRQGDYGAAHQAYQESLGIKRHIGDRQGEATSLNNLSDIAARHGDYEAARTYGMDALAIFDEVGDRGGKARMLYNLGMLFHNLGAYDQAEEYSRRGLELTQEIGERSGQGHSWANLGRALLALGDPAGAQEAFQHSLVLRQEMGQQNFMVESLAGLAEAALAKEEFAAALDYCEKMMNYLLHKTFDNTGGIFYAYLVACRILLKLEDPNAVGMVRMAYGLLQAQARGIKDDYLRQSFLENVADHREIVQLWAQYGQKDAV